MVFYPQIHKPYVTTQAEEAEVGEKGTLREAMGQKRKAQLKGDVMSEAIGLPGKVAGGVTGTKDAFGALDVIARRPLEGAQAAAELAGEQERLRISLENSKDAYKLIYGEKLRVEEEMLKAQKMGATDQQLAVFQNKLKRLDFKMGNMTEHQGSLVNSLMSFETMQAAQQAALQRQEQATQPNLINQAVGWLEGLGRQEEKIAPGVSVNFERKRDPVTGWTAGQRAAVERDRDRRIEKEEASEKTWNE